MNNYIYNPLLKFNLQFSDNDTPTPGALQKISKFFAATDVLQDDEIAQYQGETDTQNNLQPGLFYKQLQGWTKKKDGTTTAYNSTEIIDITDFNDNTISYHVLTIRNTNTPKIIYNFNNNVKVIMFSEALLNTDLQTITIAGDNLKVYPYPLVNNVWDFENMVQVVNNNLYYNNSRLIFQGSNGGNIGGRFMTDENHENLYLTDFQFIYKIDSELNSLLFEPVILSYVKSYTISTQAAEQITINNYKFENGGAGFVSVPVQAVDEELNENSPNAVANSVVTKAFSFTTVKGTKQMSVSPTATAESKYSLYYNKFFAIVIFSVSGSSQPPQAITEVFNLSIAEEFIFYVNYNSTTSVQCEVKKDNNGFYINMPVGVSTCSGYVVIPLS